MFTQRWLFAVLGWLLLSSRVPAAEPEFSFLAPLRPVDARLPPTLADIESNLEANHDLRNEDPITWGHEGTHYIDSRLVRSPVRAFYCLRGRVVRLRNPKISITRIAAHVPPPLRGAIYRSYLVNQAKLRVLDEEPLYLLNEWLAYTHGSQIRKEIGWDKRGETLRHMAEMGVYVSVLVDLTSQLDPTYDLRPLVTFIRWNASRGKEIAGDQWNGLPAFVSAAAAKYAPVLDLMDLIKKD
jgi:hypothetical protein